MQKKSKAAGKYADKRAKQSPLIELQDVWKVYKMGVVDVVALRDVSLRIYPGEFVAILGPSGSGKSTAMNMVGALDYPSKGKIFLEKRDINTLDESRLAQLRGKKIGFVFQQFNLLPTLTALENVELPMIFQGVPEHKRKQRARMLLQTVNLSHRVNNLPNQLSGGEQQRVAVARALANNPDLLLADEPTGNLDSKNGKAVIDFFRKLNKEQKKTIVMITHDQKLSRQADRIIRVKDGMVTAS